MIVCNVVVKPRAGDFSQPSTSFHTHKVMNDEFSVSSCKKRELRQRVGLLISINNEVAE